MASSAAVKLAACTSCSVRYNPAQSYLMQNNATKATVAFCGEECAHKHFNMAPPAKTNQVGKGRGETQALLAQQAKAIEDAERAAKEAENSPDAGDESDGYSSDGSSSSRRSGYSSESSTGSNSSASRRRRKSRKSGKRSKNRAVMRALKITMIKTLDGMLIVANKLLEIAADNLSAKNIKTAINIIMKGVKLAAKILPMILPLLPLLILSKQGEKQTIPDYLKQKLREVVAMIKAVIAGIKSARLTSSEFYNMQAIIKSTSSDLTAFIAKKKIQFTEGASAAAAAASQAPATGESQQQQQQQQLQLQGKQTKASSASAAAAKPVPGEGYTWDKNNSQRPNYDNDNNVSR